MTKYNSLVKLLAVIGVAILFGLPLSTVNASPNSRDNSPPYAPTITGPSFAMPGQPVPVTFCAIDPDNDTLMIYVEWGGENNSDFSDWYPAPSGVPITVNHTWNYTGVFTTRAKAEDPYGAQSPWSKPYNITISPVNITLGNTPGFFTIKVTNIGTQNLTNLTTTLTRDGGLVLGRHSKTHTTNVLPPSGTQTTSLCIFGLGTAILGISVKANEFPEISSSIMVRIFFFFIII